MLNVKKLNKQRRCCELINQHYEEGLSRVETFERIFQELKFKGNVDSATVEEWFRRYHEDEEFNKSATSNLNCYNLVELISGEYQKLRHSISSWDSDNIITSINERYAIDAVLSAQQQLYLISFYDNFYKSKREFTIKARTQNVTNYIIEVIDMEYFLLILNCGNQSNPECIVHLIRMDFKKCTLKIVNKQTTHNGHFEQLYKDVAKPHKFVGLMKQQGVFHFWFGEIKKSSLVFDQKPYSFHEEFYIGCFQLVNGEMYAYTPRIFGIEDHGSDEPRGMYGINFALLSKVENGPIETKTVATAKSSVYLDLEHLKTNEYVWLDSVCYFIKHFRSKYIIMSYNSKTQEFSRIGKYVLNAVPEFYIDANGTLTLATNETNYLTGKSETFFYKIPTNQPDKLKNLIFSNKLRQTVLKKHQELLPPYFRSFSHLPVTVEIPPEAPVLRKRKSADDSGFIVRRRSQRLQVN